jgi:sec-independent protein translocase protein TatB
MFDFSLGEMLVVALVALVVLGPERLPKAARFAGLWVRRARAQWHSVKTELEQELAGEELKRSLQAGKQALSETQQQFEAQMQEAKAQLHDAVHEPASVADAPADATVQADPPPTAPSQTR